MTIKRIHVGNRSDHDYAEWAVVTKHKGKLWLTGLDIIGLPGDPSRRNRCGSTS